MKKRSSSRLLIGGILIVLLNFFLANAFLHRAQSNTRNSSDTQNHVSHPSTGSEETSNNDSMTMAEQSLSEKQQEQLLIDIRALKAGSILDTSLLTQEMTDNLFYGEEISDTVRQRIWNCSYRDNDDISLSDLRYLRVLYLGFDGQTHVGELIVNKAIEKDILEIMAELYANKYPIEKMVLIDDYEADDDASMEDNNTSAFNYRVIAGTDKLSMHGLGLAIDINPQYNPYVSTTSTGELHISPENGADYADRSADFPHKLEENDLCCRLFLEHGFTWGGDWKSVKDYQHFEKTL